MEFDNHDLAPANQNENQPAGAPPASESSTTPTPSSPESFSHHVPLVIQPTTPQPNESLYDGTQSAEPTITNAPVSATPTHAEVPSPAQPVSETPATADTPSVIQPSSTAPAVGAVLPPVTAAGGSVVGGQPAVSSTPNAMPAAAPVTLQSTPVKSSRKKRKVLIGASALVATLLIGGGLTFGLYLPNQPQNVWKTGLEHTGQAVDGFISDATQQDKLKALATSQLSGTFDAKSDSFGSVTGSIDSWLSSTDSDSGVEVKYTGTDSKEHTVNVKVLTEIAKGNQYPDIYFQVGGISSFGLDAFVPGVNQYDNKWIYVSSDYLKSLAGSDTGGSQESVTSADVAGLVRDMSATTREYVFTGDTSKGILENRKFVGKETVDGVKTNRYTVGLNKANVKKYCEVLGTTLANSKVYKKLLTGTDDQASRKKEFIDSCKKSADGIKSSDTFDAWIGGKYRLIQKVRFTDEKNKQLYVDVGEHYTGGDELELYAVEHDGKNKTDGKFTVKTDLKTTKTTGTLTATSKESDNGYDFDMKFEIKPYTGKATITKPTNFIKLEDLIKQWQSQAASSQAQADAQLRRSQLEAQAALNE